MLVEKERRDRDGARVPDVSRTAEYSREHKRCNGDNVEDARAAKSPDNAEARSNRVEALRPINLQVVERVQHVETRYPASDRQPECTRRPGERLAKREPGSKRGQANRCSQPKVAEPGNAFQVRIDEEGDDRDRAEVAHDRRELEDREEIERQCEQAEGGDLRRSESAARELSTRGTRIARINLPVDKAVNRHRQRTGRGHGDRDPEQIRPARKHSLAAARKDRAGVREGKSEDGVLKLDKRGVAAVERCRPRPGSTVRHPDRSAGPRSTVRCRASRHTPAGLRFVARALARPS